VEFFRFVEAYNWVAVPIYSSDERFLPSTRFAKDDFRSVSLLKSLLYSAL